MTAAEGLAVGFFTVWAVATIAYQFEPRFLALRQFYGFIPYCRFFAPNPLVTDIRVYCAWSDQPSHATEDLHWTPLVSYNRGSLPRWLWNPAQRLDKSVNLMVRELIALKQESTEISCSVPYLRLLNVASVRARDEGGRYVRFLVTKHRGIEHPARQIVFASDEHRVAVDAA